MRARGGIARRGFTLLELMTVVAVVAILAAVAGPPLSTFIDNQRVRNASFDLVSDLLVARSEAVLRNANVTLTPAATGSDGWQQGWTVAVGTQTLATRTGIDSRIRIDAKEAGSAIGSLTFRGNGRVDSAAQVTIEIGHASPAPSGVTPSCVRLDATGRARSQKGACS